MSTTLFSSPPFLPARGTASGTSIVCWLFQEGARQVLVHAVLAPDVLDDLDLLDGAVWAQRTRVGFLSRVGQHVSLEVAALGEHPLAPGAHALGLGCARSGEGGRGGRRRRGGGGDLEGDPLRAPAAAAVASEVDQEGVQVSSIDPRA